MTKKIPLTQGKFTIVDDEDYEHLSKWGWCIDTDGYAVRNGKANEGHITVRMHRVILNCPKEFQIDHINNDKLDNRKENLRICTTAENCRNRKLQANNTTGYKGVHYQKDHKKYAATIKFNQKHIFIGYFDFPKDAAMAYDKKAKELFGEFACTNSSL